MTAEQHHSPEAARSARPTSSCRARIAIGDTDVMAGKQRPRCTATARVDGKGEQCRARAAPGAAVCSIHGGDAPQVAAKAEKRAALAQIERLTERLGVIHNPEDPFEAAAAALRQLRHLAQDTGEVVFGLAANGGLRYEHEKAGEQVRGEVIIWQRAVKDTADLSLAIIRAGMEAKLAEVTETQSQVMVAFIREALARFGMDFADPGVNEIIMAAFNEVVRGEKIADAPAIEVPRAPEMSVVCDMGKHENCRAYMPVPYSPVPPPWPQRCPCDRHAPRPGHASRDLRCCVAAGRRAASGEADQQSARRLVVPAPRAGAVPARRVG